MRPVRGVELTLVTDQLTSVYSGMLPGFIAGQYCRQEIEIDLVRLAGAAGARLIHAEATQIDPEERQIALRGRPPLRYDSASVNVGAASLGEGLPGVGSRALATRPIAKLSASVHQRLADLAPGARVCVVGAGAAGVELAFCCHAWIAKHDLGVHVDLLDAGELLPEHAPSLRQRVISHAERRGIGLRTGSRVCEVRGDSVTLDGGETLAADLVLWSGGAAAPAVIVNSELPKDERGFLVCDATLRVAGVEGLFAAGDCVVQRGNEWVPRAGVYAVRQGPVLDHNLRAYLSGTSTRPYDPQREYLSLLNLGDGEALGSKWGRVIEGAWVWRLKDRIDRRFVEGFRAPELSAAELDAQPMAAHGEPTDAMECGGCAAKVGQDALSSGLARALGNAGAGDLASQARVALGVAQADDVAIWKTDSGEALMATVDGFTAFTQDHYLLGQVATINALSDIWAKAGTPQAALCTLGVPYESSAQQSEVVFQLLSGVRSVLAEHSVALVGGHTQRTRQLNVGLAVWGKPGATFLPKRGAEPGDALILTKPLGTGVLLHAEMIGACHAAWRAELYQSLLTPNRGAGTLAMEHGARACTDVTGFGLIGHLLELLAWVGGERSASPYDQPATPELGARLELQHLPVLLGALNLLSRGYRSTFHGQNAALRRRLSLAPGGADRGASAARAELLFDPQTSGGLLIAIADAAARPLLSALRQASAPCAAIIGRVTATGSLQLES